MIKIPLYLFLGSLFSTSVWAGDWEFESTFSPYLNMRKVKFSAELESPIPVGEYADILRQGPCQNVEGYDGGTFSCRIDPTMGQLCTIITANCYYYITEEDDAEAYYDYFEYLRSFELYGAMPVINEVVVDRLKISFMGRRVAGDETESYPRFECVSSSEINSLEDQNVLIETKILPVLDSGTSSQIPGLLEEICDTVNNEKLNLILSKSTEIFVYVAQRYRGRQKLGKLTRLE